MNRRFSTVCVLCVVFALLLPAAALARAGTEGRATAGGRPYDLSWWSVDGGGTTSAVGDGYTLGGTAGQPDAAVWSNGDYTLAGGFWGRALVEYHVYLPLLLRGN